MYDKFVFTAFLNPKCFKDFKHSPWFQPREHHTRRDNIVPPWLKPRAMSDKFVFTAFLNRTGFKDLLDFALCNSFKHIDFRCYYVTIFVEFLV